jgi:PD-(D/E)XK nuclease superfamily
LNSKDWITLTPHARKLIRAAANGVVTQSEIMLRASCARKWFYRFACKLERKGYFDENFFYGHLMHEMLSQLYSAKDDARAYSPSEMPIEITDELVAATMPVDAVLTPEQVDAAHLARRKAQVAFDAYREHYHKLDSHLSVQGVEQQLVATFKGLTLAGKIDLIARPNGRKDGIYIWDFKTSFKLSPLIVDSWTFRFQFLFYAWLYWRVSGRKPDGIVVQGMLKNALRPKIVDRKTKRRESEDEFVERVALDFAENRADFFYRERMPLAKDALDRFEKETLMPHLDAFSRLRFGGANVSSLAMQQNTNQCHVYGSTCEYLQLCKDGWLARNEYGEREKKHEELAS